MAIVKNVNQAPLSSAFPKVMYAADSDEHKKVANEAEEKAALAAGFGYSPAPGTFGVPATVPAKPAKK